MIRKRYGVTDTLKIISFLLNLLEKIEDMLVNNFHIVQNVCVNYKFVRNFHFSSDNLMSENLMSEI